MKSQRGGTASTAIETAPARSRDHRKQPEARALALAECSTNRPKSDDLASVTRRERLANLLGYALGALTILALVSVFSLLTCAVIWMVAS